ncbi:unnamed protein product [Oncorhynchus mykiss]|uniref:non-specific serine/threonine protein kinase n=1 Tax=Oncorhynchus mykiss TaxID=8022 RepID=A0A060VTV0_ONCMY|nr:unnamed protein product [Oncorhynchus mykiss]
MRDHSGSRVCVSTSIPSRAVRAGFSILGAPSEIFLGVPSHLEKKKSIYCVLTCQNDILKVPERTTSKFYCKELMSHHRTSSSGGPQSPVEKGGKSMSSHGSSSNSSQSGYFKLESPMLQSRLQQYKKSQETSQAALLQQRGSGHLSGVKSNLSPFVKATEYSSSSDEVGSSDDEETTRSPLSNGKGKFFRGAPDGIVLQPHHNLNQTTQSSVASGLKSGQPLHRPMAVGSECNENYLLPDLLQKSPAHEPLGQHVLHDVIFPQSPSGRGPHFDVSSLEVIKYCLVIISSRPLTLRYEKIKFLVIALKNAVEVYAWAPKPYHKFMAFKSFGSLPQRPLSVDLTVEDGQRLKVIYGSLAGFHAIDVDSGTPYDLYLPTHIQGVIRPHAIIILPNSSGMEVLVCYEDEGVYIDTYGRITKETVLQWGEMPASVAYLQSNQVMGWGDKAIELRSANTGNLEGVFMHKKAQKLKFLCERNDKVFFASVQSGGSSQIYFMTLGQNSLFNW